MRKVLFLSVSLTASLAVFATSLSAQESCAPDDCVDDDPALPLSRPAEATITVTATGTRIEVEDTGQPVTVLGSEEIAQIQGADLTRVLQRAPGVSLSRNGGVGSFTGVRVRGAEAEQLLTIIDGVRMSDPAAPGGGFDYGNLLTGNLEKIELLRGSNSTVWGSDAIGGVLVASTKADSTPTASVEYGSRNTLSLNASGGLANDDGFIGVSGSYFRTGGFSAAASGTEDDGFEQWSVNGQGRMYLSYELELFARARYAEGTLEIDGSAFEPPYLPVDSAEFQETRQLSAAAGATYDSGPLFVRASYSFADTARDNYNPDLGPDFSADPGFTSDGRSDRIDVKGEWRPIGPLLVNFGAEHAWLKYATLYDAGNTTRMFGAYAQLGIEFGGLSAHVGGRLDDHARFGSATSFGADISYEIADDLRLKASLGEGFKAPTLFQLFSDFGNKTLQPERSTSFDIGLAYKSRGWLDYAGVTLFRRDSENLIDYVSCFGVTGGLCTDRPFGTYDNVGRTRAQGIELEAGKRLGDALQLRAVYAYVDSENRTSGSLNEGHVLARRPKHAVTLSADYDLDSGLVFKTTLGAELRFVSDSFDDAANSVPLSDHVLIDLRAVRPLVMLASSSQRTLDLFARIENVTDEQYQTAAGYASPGRGVFVGLRTGL